MSFKQGKSYHLANFAKDFMHAYEHNLHFVPWKTGICHLNGAFRIFSERWRRKAARVQHFEGQEEKEREKQLFENWKVQKTPCLPIWHLSTAKKRTCKACFLKKQSAVLKANDAKRTLQLSKEVQFSMRLQENNKSAN